MELINKSALVAEIERRIKECGKLANAAAEEWFPRLEQATKENAAEVADAYLEAIAKEIIDNSQTKFEDEI